MNFNKKDNVKMDTTIELSKGITIQDYLEMEINQYKGKIAEMIYQRFMERYIKPYSFPKNDYIKNYKNGFAMMGSASLMIETYMSFKKGIKNTDKIGKNCFCEFFNSEPEFSVFKDIRKNSSGNYSKKTLPVKFYSNIRCGILHQGETNEGWTITRKIDTPLFDESTLKVNAYLFMENLNRVLKRYENDLKNSNWNDEIWKNLRKKMKFVINNCQKLSS